MLRDPSSTRRTPERFLLELRKRGARRLKRVTFRANRNTIWSLTRNATALNVHVAYASAPADVLDAFATIVRQRGRRIAAVREAGRVVQDWPGLAPVLEAVRKEQHSRRARRSQAGASRRGVGTPEQRMYFRAVYRYFNRTRFSDLLPPDLPIRLSGRMTTALGHMMPGPEDRENRSVAEIALNVDLLAPENAVLRVDTLLHEMAHAADYLVDGNLNHGRPWRVWARRVGCRPTAQCDRGLQVGGQHGANDPRVPPLPVAVRSLGR